MKSTFNLLFYLRKNRPSENGMVPIMGRITINGERAQFSTKTEVHPSQWDAKTGRCIGRTTEIGKTNRILDSLRVKVTDLYHSHLNDYGYVLPEKLKIFYWVLIPIRRKCFWSIFKNTTNSIYSKLAEILPK
jgi:hypothetical protein